MRARMMCILYCGKKKIIKSPIFIIINVQFSSVKYIYVVMK